VREKINAALGGATPEEQRKVLFENAAKLYKIEAPDIAPPVPSG
jgi:predicted TIM-barrel fold metal-dependent hydrolase